MRDYFIETETATLHEYGIEFFRDKRENGHGDTLAHNHSAVEFLYIESGKLAVGVDQDTLVVGEGDMVILHAHVIHAMAGYGAGVCRYFVLKVMPSFLFDMFVGPTQLTCILPFLFKHVGAQSVIRAADMTPAIRGIWQRMAEELDRNDENCYNAQRIQTAALLLTLIRTLPAPPTDLTDSREVNRHTVDLIYRSVAYINDNYAGDISATDCAERINISYSYFAKLFRAVIGKTFKEYLTSVRMSKAKNMLLTGDLSITDTAVACGYVNLSYFTSEYKRVYGETPRETRHHRYSGE